MKNKNHSILVSHMLIIIVVGIGLIVSIPWPYETALFPRTTGIIIELVAILSIISEVHKKNKTERSENMKPAIDSVIFRKALVTFCWLAGYVVSTWFVGFMFASVIYVFFFTKVKGRQNWLISILCSAGAAVFIEVMFIVLLRNRWFPGALWGWLGL